MERTLLADDEFREANRVTTQAHPGLVRHRAADPTECPIGLEPEPDFELGTGFIEHFLQTRDSPILLLAHPRQTEEGS